MGLELTAAVRAFIAEQIAVPQPDITASATTRNWVESRIQSYLEGHQSEPQLYRPQRFVHYGSYFKGTNVGGVDEYDILVVIDSNGGFYRIDGATFGTGQGSASPNHKYDPAYQKMDGSGVSPTLQLRWLKRIVDASLGPSNVPAATLTDQTVKVWIAASRTTIELVPAGVFTRAVGDRFYNIPSGRNDGWTLTQPESDIQRVADAAATRPGFRHMVRLIKHLNNVYGMSLPSFAIETAIVDAAPYFGWSEYEDFNLVNCLNRLAAALDAGTVPDPYQPTVNLLAGRALVQDQPSLLRGIAARITDYDSNNYTPEVAKGLVYALLGAN